MDFFAYTARGHLHEITHAWVLPELPFKKAGSRRVMHEERLASVVSPDELPFSALLPHCIEFWRSSLMMYFCMWVLTCASVPSQRKAQGMGPLGIKRCIESRGKRAAC